MTHGSHHSRGLQLAARATNAFRVRDWTLNQIDPDGLRYVANILAWMHWGVGVLCLVELTYRPFYGYWAPQFVGYVVLLGTLMAFNGCFHYLIRSNRAVTWRWFFAMCAVDVAIISAGAAISNGFSHYFFHLFYYPSLAFFAVVFTSFRINMAWVTMVAAIYLGISVLAGDGLDFEAKDEKPLLARLAVMYVVVVTVNLISRFERMRWRQGLERERSMQRERVEFSQAVHDTTAQSAYMIGLGIDTAKAQAGDANPELAATLEATSRLSRSTMWELRHPINMGGIYEGRDLGWALRAHAASFTNITSVPAELSQTGVEPPLSIEERGLLFSIAHNALTNAYRHADAGRVSVDLEFGEQGIRLSVSDDGAGLPDDYAERGRGFANMSRDAERLGGRLVVEERGAMGGAAVTCVIPAKRRRDNGYVRR